MRVPNNEGKACDAVIRILEERTGETRANVYRSEDQIDRHGSRIELCLTLGTTVYAIEHTRIETFRDQIKRGISFASLVRSVIAELDGQLPGPALYDLILPLDRQLRMKRRQLERTQETLVCWISENAEELYESIMDGASPHTPLRNMNDYVEGKPPYFPFGVRLRCQVLQCDSGPEPVRIGACRIAPESEELEQSRADALLQSLNDKCPKLDNFRKEEERKGLEVRTLLVLESDDIALTNEIVVAEIIPKLLAARLDAPDEIYLIETEIDTWWIRPIKCGTEYWLMDGLTELNSTQFRKDNLIDLQLHGCSKGPQLPSDS